ncbi:MAG: XdhC family protein [Oscillospiraceae bacterium]|jgi:xanthine dehydrogenase accessory factor|nr:XdhC family protein [Oscillospiraceae bacterium]
MKKLAPRILDALKRGERAALSLVVDSSGSTPRKAGSCMVCFADGRSLGTVGGGAVEYEAQRVASELLAGNFADVLLTQGVEDVPPDVVSATLGYSLSSDETGDLCMICGGDVYLHFHLLEPTAETLALFTRLTEAVAADTDSWLLLKIAAGSPTSLTLIRRGEDAAEDAALLRRVPVYDEDGTGIFALPLTRAGRVYIFGGGHVAQELVPALTRVDFACVVYEDRPDFADPALFPGGAGTILGSFDEISGRVAFHPSDFVVVLTRGHKNDYSVLAQTLPSAACYVGCIGSKRKMAIIRNRLRDEAALPPDVIARLKSPIGLEIEAETPAELAVSIAAEMIQFRAAGQA